MFVKKKKKYYVLGSDLIKLYHKESLQVLQCHQQCSSWHNEIKIDTVECAQVDHIKYDSVFGGTIAPSQSPQSKIWRHFIIATFRGYGVKVPLFFWFEAVWGRKPQVINLRGLAKRLVRSDWNLKGRLLTYKIEEIWCLVRVKMPPIKKMVRLRDIKNDCRKNKQELIL